MKKFLSALLVCLMVVTMSTAMVFAADNSYSITADKTTLTPGDVVTLTVKLTGTNTGIAGYKNTMSFDSTAFERTTITYQGTDEDDNPVDITEEIRSYYGDLTINDAQAGKTIMTYSGSANKTGKNIIKICYKVKETAVNGTNYTFTITCNEAVNANKNYLTIDPATTEAITITGGVEGGSGSTDIIVEEEDFTSVTDDSVTSADVTSGDVKVNGTVIATMGEGGKIHTYFNKNAAGKTLEAEKYGIEATINGKTFRFPGKTAVSADKAWAIKLVIPNGKFADGVEANVTNISVYTIEAN